MESRGAEDFERLAAFRPAIDIAQGRFTEFAPGVDLAGYLRSPRKGR